MYMKFTLQKKQRQNNSATNDNLFVVGYRTDKVQLVCVDVVGVVSRMIDINHWNGRRW